jgi:plasmid stabilization system protein ParE
VAELRRTRVFVDDLAWILNGSASEFEPVGRRRHAALLKRSLRDLAGDPRREGVRGVVHRPGICFYHIRHSRHGVPDDLRVRQPRHVIVFRILDGGGTVELLRLLHERMLLEAWLWPVD